jgi:cob(I)alamin adenosyltransferase
MTIYTRTGDLGETGLFGGPRVEKDMLRIEACGAVDELNCVLGVARAESLPEEIDVMLRRIQNELFEVGAELASPDPVAKGTRSVSENDVRAIEDDINRVEPTLSPLDQFILPGGTRAGAALHQARAVSRRAERRLVSLARNSPEPISQDLLAYLNRLSDLLFVLARATNASAGQPDVTWRKRR